MRIVMLLAAAWVAALAVAACAGGGMTSTSRARGTTARLQRAGDKASGAAVVDRPAPPPYARLLASTQGSAAHEFVPAAVWRGQTAAYVARSAAGMALLSFNQHLVKLNLHSGTVDAGPTGWRYGPAVGGAERRHLLSAFNGGFKFDVGAGGFMSAGRVGAPLRDGLASIVTYTDGYTDIGSWHLEVPAAGRTVASVRQNLQLLIDHGRPAANVSCDTCWGATLGGVTDLARSALGVTAAGNLIWAGGEHATVTQLADTLRSARVVRAVELDINPEWVASYVYGHRGGRGPLAVVPIVPDQPGVPGQFLAPYGRDFFSVVTR
jgi:hypothetical protein